MSSQLDSTDFVPEIDQPISHAVRQKLLAQVEAERPSDMTTNLHPLINDTYTPNFPQSLSSEHDRLEAGKPKTDGIDLSRYEATALEPPNRTFPSSDSQRPELLTAWRSTLKQAYTSSTYLTGRNTNLALLETYGKNAWLVGNWNAEAELKSLEAELRDVKGNAEILAAERTARQEGAKAEMVVLEESWKKGISGIVEVQVATANMRREVLEARKNSS